MASLSMVCDLMLDTDSEGEFMNMKDPTAHAPELRSVEVSFSLS